MKSLSSNMTIEGLEFNFTDEEINKMQQLGITRSIIATRVKDGWSRFYIVNQPKRMTREDFEDILAIKKYNNLLKQRRELYQNERLERKLREKAHLEKYPQKVKASRYYYSLCKFALKKFNEVG